MDDAVVSGNLRKRAVQQEDGTYVVRLPQCASWENYGSAIEAFAEILRGHNDGLLYEGPHLWDVAAGCLLVEEAGGKARMELVDPADIRGKTRCVASTGKIFDELSGYAFDADQRSG
jgi:fructose-1,6-bisphosphatase/inositol monophosphatase family enzyme